MQNNWKKVFWYILLYVTISIVILWGLYYFHIGPFSPSIPSIEEIHVNSWVSYNEVELKIHNDCSFSGSEYNFLDIADYSNIINTPSDYQNFKGYTKKINVSGDISDLYFCIISDVRKDYKIKGAYYFTTYAYLGNNKNAWQVNVWYNINNKQTYDNSTDKRSPQLIGKFYWNETPFVQILNWNNIIVADMNDWSYKSISPIKLFKHWTIVSIWWYVNSYPNYWAGKIIMYRIIYKWWDLELIK
jgi:hypothetical protein